MARIGARGERLSSALTLPLAIAVTASFALGAVVVARSAMATEPAGLAATAGCLLVAAVFAVTGLRFKKVTATARGLVVSGLRREILVPYDQIASVRESASRGSRPITVELRSPTAFGTRIVFVPYVSLAVVGDHPAAVRIRERVEAARSEPG